MGGSTPRIRTRNFSLAPRSVVLANAPSAARVTPATNSAPRTLVTGHRAAGQANTVRNIRRMTSLRPGLRPIVRSDGMAALAASRCEGTTMHEDTTFDAPGVGGGISRRDMLRKSAVVGGAGALMWAAPSITKYGSAAFGSEGTPLTGFSYAAAILDCGDEYIRIKYNRDGDDQGFEDDPGALPQCDGDEFDAWFQQCWEDAKKPEEFWPFGDRSIADVIAVSQSGDYLFFDLGGDFVNGSCQFIDCAGQVGVIQGGTLCDQTGVEVQLDGQKVRFNTSLVK